MPHDILTRFLALATLVLTSLFAAGCGGGGGGASDVAKTGDVVVVVADARRPSVGLADASVTITAGKATRTSTTGADGLVTFRDLPAGSATIKVVRDLYREYSSTGVVQGASAVGLTALMVRRTGDINVNAIDAFDAPVPNVQLLVSVEGQTIAAVTGANGQAVLQGVPTAAVTVQAAATGFLPEPAQAVTVVESPAASVEFAMDRKTEPAGGTVTPPPPVVPDPPPADAGQTLVIRVRSVVVDGQGVAIEDRQAADFTLQACTDADPALAECVSSSTDPAFDAAYTPVRSSPDTFAKVLGVAPVPYAVALGYDQSGSISTSDPSDARVFASKGFLQTVQSGDRVVLGAFAEGAEAKIPTKPLTLYGAFTSDGVGYFDELDQFPALEGGNTPLYQGLDALLQYTAQNAPTGVAGLRKAVVLFSDGFDTVCADALACRQNSIALARSLGVNIYTIGLADSVDTPTLSELAHQTNGAHLVAANPEQLNALYGSLGGLLRGTITTYETTWTIHAPNAGAFASGRSVLGKVRVATADKLLELPFVYTVP